MIHSDHYTVLEVERKATAIEIKSAFHALAKKWHPDLNPGNATAEVTFKKINEAYVVLSDQLKRNEYDTRTFGDSHKQHRRNDMYQNFDFGGGSGGSKQGGYRRAPRKGGDLVLETEVSFRDAALGAQKVVAFRLNGVREELNITIPAGIESGSKIRLSGKGDSGEAGGPPGDLLLVIRILSDPDFTRSGGDLFVKRSITSRAARTGTPLEVPTLHGDMCIEVAAGTRSGTKIRVKGGGTSTPDSKVKGDLYVVIDVQATASIPPIHAPEPADILAQYAVVIVDDEPYILQALQRLFRREPYKLYCADSGAEGLQIVSETPLVAVIISDQRMPKMNGAEFLTLSRATAPDAVKMLLTSYSDIESAVSAMNEGGATRYIRKPWMEEDLLHTVRDSVKQYHLIMENRRQQETISLLNEELSSWNSNLKDRVLAQTAQVRKQVEKLHGVNRRQQENFHGVIETLAVLTELRAPKSRRHSANTATLSVAMARSLALPAAEIETIRVAALLHDIGKNAQSDIALATDENSLSGEERITYLKHPVLGQTAVDSIKDLRSAGILIRHHHECYDGTGFPDGLSGSAIPLGAALIALADMCDREMTFRGGRDAVELVLQKLADQSGTAFVPHLIPLLTEPAHALYDHQYVHTDHELTELEVEPHKLKEGMVLTKDLYGSSGLFLMEAWTELDHEHIATLQRICSLDPIPGGIAVGIFRNR